MLVFALGALPRSLVVHPWIPHLALAVPACVASTAVALSLPETRTQPIQLNDDDADDAKDREEKDTEVDPDHFYPHLRRTKKAAACVVLTALLALELFRVGWEPLAFGRYGWRDWVERAARVVFWVRSVRKSRRSLCAGLTRTLRTDRDLCPLPPLLPAPDSRLARLAQNPLAPHRPPLHPHFRLPRPHSPPMAPPALNGSLPPPSSRIVRLPFVRRSNGHPPRLDSAPTRRLPPPRIDPPLCTSHPPLSRARETNHHPPLNFPTLSPPLLMDLARPAYLLHQRGTDGRRNPPGDSSSGPRPERLEEDQRVEGVDAQGAEGLESVALEDRGC